MLDTFNMGKLTAELSLDEGRRANRYRDSRGIWTIGIGHNLQAAPLNYPEPWSNATIDMVLAHDVASSIAKLDRYAPWWRKLAPARQRVLINMCFNMGWGDGAHGLSSFKYFLSLVKAGRYTAAATDMLTTKWARQVGARAARLSKLMRAGV